MLINILMRKQLKYFNTENFDSNIKIYLTLENTHYNVFIDLEYSDLSIWLS